MDPVSFNMGGPIKQSGKIQRQEGLAGDGSGPESIHETTSFSDLLADSINEVNDLQNKADASLEKLVSSQTQDIHQVMIAFEQARLTMQTMVEVRNKLVESYQEVSRMPM